MVSLIVVGVDGSDNAGSALRWAAELAAQTGGSLLVVHVFEPLDHLDELGPSTDFVDIEEAARRRVGAEWCAPCVTLGVEFDVTVVEGDPAEALAAVAADASADLIVVGSRGGSGFLRFAAGSTSTKLVHISDRPVAVIPHTEEASTGG